jgi:hypothetical protein
VDVEEWQRLVAHQERHTRQDRDQRLHVSRVYSRSPSAHHSGATKAHMLARAAGWLIQSTRVRISSRA